MKKRYTEAQIIGFLQETESGIPVEALCRRRGFAQGSFYLYRSKFGGMSVQEHTRAPEGPHENLRL